MFGLTPMGMGLFGSLAIALIFYIVTIYKLRMEGI